MCINCGLQNVASVIDLFYAHEENGRTCEGVLYGCKTGVNNIRKEGRKITKKGPETGQSVMQALFDELNEDFCRLALRLTGAKLSPISWRSRPQQQV